MSYFSEGNSYITLLILSFWPTVNICRGLRRKVMTPKFDSFHQKHRDFLFSEVVSYFSQRLTKLGTLDGPAPPQRLRPLRIALLTHFLGHLV